jgi:hypothetical protein
MTEAASGEIQMDELSMSTGETTWPVQRTRWPRLGDLVPAGPGQGQAKDNMRLFPTNRYGKPLATRMWGPRRRS